MSKKYVSILLPALIGIFGIIGFVIYQKIEMKEPTGKSPGDVFKEGLVVKDLPKEQIQKHDQEEKQKQVEKTANNENDDVISDWQHYNDKRYGLSFDYPKNLVINGKITSSKYLFDFEGRWPNKEKDAISIYTNDLPFYNPPPETDIWDWLVNKHGKKFEEYGDGYFSNKIGDEFKVSGLPTAHLVSNEIQDFPRDEFYIIKNQKLFKITLFGTWDTTSWQYKFLNSITFTE